jgi:C-terminal processing protease CtpA/Prc
VKYNFAFFDQVPEVDWDAILLEYIPKVQEAETGVAYYRVLRRCMALLKDGHTGVWGPSEEPSYEPPIQVEAVRNQAVVLQVCPIETVMARNLREEIETANVCVGDIVTHVDGRPVQQVLSEDIYPYQFASTSQALDRKAYPRLLRGAYGTRVRLGLLRLDGSRAEVILTRGRYRFARQPNEFSCRALPGGLTYVNLNSFGSDQVVKEFDDVFDRIETADGLILDVRRNGGGSSRHGYAILSRLVDENVPGSHWRSRKHIAAHKAWGRKEQWEEGDHSTITPHGSKYYGGPVVLLAGPDTGSAAEDFVVAFQTARRGKVVGQKTNGSTGQPLFVKLPGGGGARICTKRDTYPDGREFVGIGCIPDVEVERTREDVAAGRDAALEKAIEVLRSQIRSS